MSNKFLTVVIQLPHDQEQCKEITNLFGIEKDFHGGTITAMSQDDEITINELFEEELGVEKANAIRAQLLNN